MNRHLVAGLALAVVSGCGGIGASPTKGPVPAPATSAPLQASLVARGTFTLYSGEVHLEVTRSDDSVTGTMSVTHEDGNFAVDIECARTTADGVILLAGDITESASPHARKGAREVLVLKPGSPAYASLDSEGRPGGDVRPAASCPELLEQVIQTGTQTVVDDNGLAPIEGGSVEFGP